MKSTKEVQGLCHLAISYLLINAANKNSAYCIFNYTHRRTSVKNRTIRRFCCSFWTCGLPVLAFRQLLLQA